MSTNSEYTTNRARLKNYWGTEMTTDFKLMALVDGSIYSVSVCDHARWLVDLAGGSVDIVHVLGRRQVSSGLNNFSGSIGLGARTALLEELVELDSRQAIMARKRGRAILEDAEQRILDQGVSAVSTKLRHGEIVETVEDLGKEADILVIGKRGEAADFERLHLGSNLERVARTVKQPILVVSREFKPIKRFLIAFDGGASALKAVADLAAKGILKGLECEILMAGSDSSEASRQLQQAAASLAEAGYSVSSRLVPGQAEQVICEAVEIGNHGLLVMGAFGHSRIRNLIIGSTTTQMLRACKIPLLLYR